MEIKSILHSKEDASVNFIFDNDMEARFVQRTPEYIIVYLSSQTGCNKACRFCHLTQTHQTKMIDATISDYGVQADVVLEHWSKKPLCERMKLKKVHFNFMARGEVLANSIFLEHSQEILNMLDSLKTIYTSKSVESVFNISTIMPEEINSFELDEIFDENQNIRIYYSLYSMDDAFRKRWIPKATSPIVAMRKLSMYQQQYGIPIKFHWAFIEGQNDSIVDLKKIFDYADELDLQPSFNIVRYNPFSELQGKETSEENLMILRDYIQTRVENVKIIPRVGISAKASCGMFVSDVE